jgi:hypothetical protein
VPDTNRNELLDENDECYEKKHESDKAKKERKTIK